jgi:hypothetical protein
MKDSIKKVINYAINFLDATGCEYVIRLPDGRYIDNKEPEVQQESVVENTNKDLVVRFYFKIGSTGNYRWKHSGLYSHLEAFVASQDKNLFLDISHLGSDSAKSLQSTSCGILTKALGKDGYKTKTIKGSQVIQISKR